MGSLYAKDVLDTALAEVGYQADGKWNKYADELDKIDFFSGCGKKQYQDYCSVYTSWTAYKSTRNANGDIEPDKWDAHYFLYQPDSNDCAAVVGYIVDYYASHDAYFTDPQDLERGDQMIFQNSRGYSHTGWCYDYDNDYIYTVEGNVNGGKVDKKKYPYSEFGNYIAGFGRPRYDGWEYKPADDNNEPEPKPTPEPTPILDARRIRVSSWLNVRTTPIALSDNSNKAGELYDGAVVYVFEEKDGWARIGENLWISSDFFV